MIDAQEGELVRRAAGGDLAAFAELVRAHEPGLRQFTRRLAGENGDDVAQEAFLAAWRRLGQWRGEGSFAGWLRSIATRRYFDQRRRPGQRAFAELDRDLAEVDPESDRRIAIDRALAALPARERAAALLVFGEGHSHGEAASTLGIPLGTLKSVVARARAALIPLLEGVE